MPTITPETVIGGLGVIGCAIVALKKVGLVTFGRPTERRNCAMTCAEHEKVVRDAAMATQEAKANTDHLKSDIADIKENILRIESKGDQREQRIEEEFRRLRELLGELSGYVKAIHQR